MSSLQGERPGLRERKKARTRAAIQDAALRLYIEQGYAGTTIEQIAEAAEVSQSTFFRYFPTKSETVMYDRLDPPMFESFLRQPAGLSPAAAMRAAVHEVLQKLSEEDMELEVTRWRLVSGVPELRAGLALRIDDESQIVAELVAKRVGKEPDDFGVMTYTGALIGVLIAAFTAAHNKPDSDFVEHFDRAFEYFDRGLPL